MDTEEAEAKEETDRKIKKIFFLNFSGMYIIEYSSPPVGGGMNSKVLEAGKEFKGAGKKFKGKE